MLEAARLLKPGGRIVVTDRFRSARPLDAEEGALLERRLAPAVRVGRAGPTPGG